jgi:hypothetical protein
MLTIFTLPKPFEGDIGRIQRNAIHSWKRLSPACEIFLCGNTPDLDDVATQLEVDRVSEIVCTEFGTPLVSSAFNRVAALSRHDVLCYANADLIFLPDFLEAIRVVLSEAPRFLLVGECWDVNVDGEVWNDDSVAGISWEDILRQRVASAGAVRGPEWIDFFVFRKGTIGPLPDFVVGRPGWDNWMVWHARSLEIPVVDISAATLVVHQSHDYAHVPRARGSRWEGPEGDANRALLDFRQNQFSLEFATHRLIGSRVLPNRTRGIRRRLRVGLLNHAWTVPLYRLLLACYQFARRSRPDSETGAGLRSSQRSSVFRRN